MRTVFIAFPVLGFLCAWPAAADETVERRLAVMGTDLRISVTAADRELALEASEAAVGALERTEARLSTWRDDSELSQLNRAPVGRPITLYALTRAELAAADRCRRDTTGRFDPAVGALVAAWGLRTGGRIPTPQEIEAALAQTGLEHVEIAALGAVKRRAVLLDAGGFGKGAGLARALEALAAYPVTRAVLDLGGQTVVYPADLAHELNLAHPARRDEAVARLKLSGGSVATSGNSERGSKVQGRPIGHVLDPLTGKPVDDFGSVTVWDADPLRADCLSTGLFVMGAAGARSWLAANPAVSGLVLEVASDGSLRGFVSPAFARRVEALAGKLRLSGLSDGQSGSHAVH